jgi:hypothetical protein
VDRVTRPEDEEGAGVDPGVPGVPRVPGIPGIAGDASHLTPEQLDDLAARARADVDPDREEVNDRGDVALQRHLEVCAACRSALGDQVEVGALLRREPDLAPMPADVAARLDTALAAAVAARPAVRSGEPTEGTGRARPVGTDDRMVEGNVLSISSGSSGRPGRLGRLAESRVTKSLVAAAAVALIAAGGFAAVHRNASNDRASAGASASTAGGAKAAAPGAALAAVPIRASGTAYTSANIRAKVTQQLAVAPSTTAGSAHQPATGTDATTLSTPAGLQACLTALQAPPSVPPLLVDLATFNGKPAAVLVLPDSSGVKQLWVVSRTCAPGKDGTLLFANLG